MVVNPDKIEPETFDSGSRAYRKKLWVTLDSKDGEFRHLCWRRICLVVAAVCACFGAPYLAILPGDAKIALHLLWQPLPDSAGGDGRCAPAAKAHRLRAAVAARCWSD